ncbi:PAP_central domain-containing protein, partial [Meloidogyne graminicola]
IIIGGSTFLQTAGPDSDLDIIFIFPQKCICPNYLNNCEKCQKNKNFNFCTKHELFFGSNEKSFALHLKKEINNLKTIKEFEINGYSLSGSYINSIENARVPIISILISQIEMDIMACPIPFDNIPNDFDLINIENEIKINKNLNLFNKLIKIMIKQNEQFYNKNILVLTGYRIAYQIKSKFIQPKFQLLFINLMRSVKLWAKKKQIYSNIFGYLSGTILIIMVAKINLKYSNGGLNFLLKQFFEVYSEWQWPFPVMIEPLTNEKEFTYLNEENNLIKSWNFSNISEQQMPIISPNFPEQNVAFNINEFTKNIIIREMKKASDLIKNNKSINKNSEWWQKILFKPINYKQIYKHFILIICTVPNKITENLNNYNGKFTCGLLKTKLRIILKLWALNEINLEEYHAISGFEKERKCERKGYLFFNFFMLVYTYVKHYCNIDSF